MAQGSRYHSVDFFWSAEVAAVAGEEDEDKTTGLVSSSGCLSSAVEGSLWLAVLHFLSRLVKACQDNC